MDQSQFLEYIKPYIGGTENISWHKNQDGDLFITVKDRNLVVFEHLKKMENVIEVEFNRNHLRIKMQKTIEEEKKVAKKENINYRELAKKIIENIGGKGNVKSLRHCYTRLRFVLNDESMANTDVLKNTDGIITVVISNGEYMIVIGDKVSVAYKEICDQIGFNPDSAAIKENEDEKKKGNIGSRVLSLIMASMHPLVNLICAGGIIKGILTILGMLGIVSADSGFHLLLNGMGDAIFYFLPIALGYNMAKNLGSNPFIGFLIGAILCYPTLNGVDITLFGHVVKATYTGTFLPVAFIVAGVAPLEKWLDKVLPNLVKSFLTPVIVLLIAIPLGFTVIGPIANWLGEGINTGIKTLLSISPLVAAIITAGLWQVMVLFGVHGVLSTFIFMNLAAGNTDQILAIIIFVCFSQSAVVLAIYMKTKDIKLKAVALPAFISGIFGITEPAIYGVTLPRMKMFVISCIGAAIGGVVVILTGVTGYAFTGTGFVAILGMLNPNNPQILPVILVIVVQFVASFIMAFLTYSDNDKVNTK